MAAKIYERADLLINLKRYEEAISLLQQSLLHEPHSYDLTCQLARAYLLSDRPANALKISQTALVIDPEQEWAYRILSLAHAAQNNYKAALKTALQAARIAPEEPEVLKCLAYTQVGAKKIRLARKTALQLQKIAPDWSETYRLLGYIAQQRKRWQEAQQYYHQALAANPQDENALNNLGVILLHKKAFFDNQGKRYYAAIDYFYRALLIAPNDQLIQNNLYAAVTLYLDTKLFTLTKNKALQQLVPAVRELYLNRLISERTGLHQSAVYHWLANRNWRIIVIWGILTGGRLFIALFVLAPIAFLVEGVVKSVMWLFKKLSVMVSQILVRKKTEF
jgi:tetratricopeptide (TPR) repeat protein